MPEPARAIVSVDLVESVGIECEGSNVKCAFAESLVVASSPSTSFVSRHRARL